MRSLTIFFLLLIAYSIESQEPAYNSIGSNKIFAGMHSDGTMFMNEEKDAAGYLVNYDENLENNVATLYSASIWAAGVNRFGVYKSSAMVYGGKIGDGKFSYGPYDSETNVDFNKVWKVSIVEIEDLIDDYEDGQIDDEPSLSLLEWPGRGNPYYNGELPDQHLAPFYDVNNDGIYNPYQGDYPVIALDNKNIIPSEMLYTVYNDNNETFINGLDIEIHTLLYSFNCDEEKILENSVFVRHRIVKKNDDVEDCKFGFWKDPDLGCEQDDGYGCLIEQNTEIIYNLNSMDGNQNWDCGWNVNSFNDNPGVQAVMLLNQNLDAYMHHFSGSSEFAPSTFLPYSTKEYYRVMNGIWKDGMVVTSGNYGYNPGSENEAVKYVFPDDPLNTEGWSNYAYPYTYGNGRTIMISNMDTMLQEDQFVVDMALVFSQDSMLNNLETIQKNKDDMAYIQSLYDNTFEENCITFTSIVDTDLLPVKIYPNPAQDLLIVDANRENLFIEILNIKGQVIRISKSKDRIDISDLKRGVYIIRIADSADTSYVVKRFLKL